jgi:methionyl-tRNA formyltransferase
MIETVLDELAKNGGLHETIQPEEGATYAKMLKKEEGRINWNNPAIVIDRQIRALNPWPGTWCETETGKRLKLLEATLVGPASGDAGTIHEDGIISCGDDTSLKLESIQPENKKPINVRDAYSGGYLKAGQKLS